MNDKIKTSSALAGQDFPDNFARGVIARARREQSQRRLRARIVAGSCVVLMLGLVPLHRLVGQQPDTTSSAALAWQDDSAEATQLAEATAPDEVSDYLAPETTRLSNGLGSYADVSWQYDSDWESD